MSILVSHCHLQLLAQYTIHVSTYIFKEGSTFRGTLKTKAQEVVRNKIDLEPDLGALVGGCGQAEYNEYVTRHVQECIDKCAFLHDGEDDQVRYRNSRLNFTNDVLARAKKITSTIVH